MQSCDLPMATLQVHIDGTLLRGVLDLDDERVEFLAQRAVLGIGEDCEIRVQGRRHCICRRHVELDHLDGTIRIRDLNSPQGIFINRTHVATQTPWPLRDGDVVHIGVRDFLVRID